MARIKMPAARSAAKELTFEEAFNNFLTDPAARGLADKTLRTWIAAAAHSRSKSC